MIHEILHIRSLLKAAEEDRDRALGVKKLYTSVGTNTDMFQYQSAGTSMDSQTFFSVDTSMDLQQYQSTDMGTEIVMDNVDWIQGRAALNFLECLPNITNTERVFHTGSRDIIVEGVSCESIELHEKSQMSMVQLLPTGT